MKARDHRSQSLKLLEIRLMLPPSSAKCERAHTHTHTHTPKGHLALFSLSRGSKGPWSETGRSEGNAIRTAQPRQTLFAFSSSLPSASKVPSASALQDISLNRISSGSQLPASALRATSKLRAQIPGGTDLALACASSASMPYTTTHLGKGTAPAPSKARAVCAACLKLLGNTSNTVQSAGLRLWPTRQEQRQ